MGTTLIAGGGAAGMLAAVYAAKSGDSVLLFEQNEKLGKKLFITGKGRCNFTNACPTPELLEQIVTNAKFMYSSLYGYSSFDVMDFFEKAGMPFKIERGNRVFPSSDHASDVIDALRNAMRQEKVEVHLDTKVEEILSVDGRVTGLVAGGKRYDADKVIIATGGLSYPSTGSTGDGYRFARETGHRVTERYPSLVPLTVREDYVKELQGLSLKNVELTVKEGERVLFREFGEMMFTHFGITGPLVLRASALIGPALREKNLKGYIDLKPALTPQQLDARLLREFEEGQNRQFKNVIGALYPAKLTPVMRELTGIAPEKKVNEITREERRRILELTKAFPFTVTGLRDFKEAIITKGGVDVRDIRPKTMESKQVKGLCFAGEVLDVDAFTGGFNLQVAWSTAYAAAKREETV